MVASRIIADNNRLTINRTSASNSRLEVMRPLPSQGDLKTSRILAGSSNSIMDLNKASEDEVRASRCSLLSTRLNLHSSRILERQRHLNRDSPYRRVNVGEDPSRIRINHRLVKTRSLSLVVM